MEKKIIVAELVQSNKSENQVWFVHVNGTDNPEYMGYCKHAIKALQFCFVLKARTGGSIDDDTMKTLQVFYAENEKGKLNWYKPRKKEAAAESTEVAAPAMEHQPAKRRGRPAKKQEEVAQ